MRLAHCLVPLSCALLLVDGCNAPEEGEEEASDQSLTADDCHSIIRRADKDALPDLDQDRLPDEYEECLLQVYAPIYRLSNEKYLPANVDWFLARSQLRFHHDNCDDDDLEKDPTQDTIVNRRTWHTRTSAWQGCAHTGGGVNIRSRSVEEGQLYFLELDHERYFTGASDPREWTVYGHVYPGAGGPNVQYWAFYAYSDGWKADNHEGDWETITVQVDRWGKPARVMMAAHGKPSGYAPGDLTWSGTHPHIYVAEGTHASYPSTDVCNRVERSATLAGISTPTPGCLPASQTRAWYSSPTAVASQKRNPLALVGALWGGKVVNVGELEHPLNGQIFIQSNVRWGEQGSYYNGSVRSGPFGPTFGAHWNFNYWDGRVGPDSMSGLGNPGPEFAPQAQCPNSCPPGKHMLEDCTCACDTPPSCTPPETPNDTCGCNPNATVPPPSGNDWR